MVKLDTPIRLDASRFLRWWSGELAFLVPPVLRKLLGRSSEFLALIRSGDGLEARHLGPDGERSLGWFGMDEAGNLARQKLLEENLDLAEIRVLLRLRQGQCLRRRLKLPAAAEENLTQVLAFEMDRLTPFKADRVYFSARVMGRLAATRQIAVELVLIPKEKLDALLDELALGGWQPDAVDPAGDPVPAGHNLLPEKYRPVRSRWPHILNGTLAGLAVILLATLLVLPVLIQQSLVEQLEQEVKKASKVATEVESLRQEADKLMHETHFLVEKKRTEPVLLDALEELTRVIPDKTWLNGLQFKDRRIVMQGQSPSASSLIELIEASDYFKNTSFVSPVTKDTASGLERFQIASDVVNGRFSKKTDSPQ